MKIKGFLKDVGGASRVTARRKELFETASDKLVLSDPIGDVANALHPGSITLEVASITPASPTAKTIRFISKDKKLPVFQAGQYLSLKLNIGDTLTSRPYSISSAPFETRTDNPFVEITVRNKGESFASDYLYKSLKIGDNLSGTMPHGQFYFEELRDAKNIVAIAGGSGITPFISMAREIEHGTLDVNLTILYGSNEVSDIILKDRLDAIKSDRVRVVHVIANDPSWSGEKGFITSEIIKKYSAGDTTYFLCGPQVMCKFVLGELDKLHIAPRRIRREVFGAPREIENYEGYPESAKGKTFKLT
ncbi:MAG: FAD-binding oxidoreductase, partial [Oscillospiraceae bacterium]